MKHANNTTVDSNNKETEILTLNTMVLGRFYWLQVNILSFEHWVASSCVVGNSYGYQNKSTV